MPARYSRTQIILHWAVTGLIAVQFLAHDGIEAAWRAYARTGIADPGPGATLHIVFGLAVLGLVAWRLALRVTHGTPPRPEGHPLAARAVSVGHWTLYGLMLLVPLSGAAGWFLGIAPAAEAHEVLKTLLLIVILGHVGAALVHRFWLRDGVLARMLPGG